MVEDVLFGVMERCRRLACPREKSVQGAVRDSGYWGIVGLWMVDCAVCRVCSVHCVDCWVMRKERKMASGIGGRIGGILFWR